jgi:hypothetical protein
VGFIGDAVGGRSQIAHQAAINRMMHAGAAQVTAHALVMEFFRDWDTPQADDARSIWHSYRKEEEELLLSQSHISTR